MTKERRFPRRRVPWLLLTTNAHEWTPIFLYSQEVRAPGSPIPATTDHFSPITIHYGLGRGRGVGRALGIGAPLGVGVGRGVEVGVAVTVAVGEGVAVGVDEGVAVAVAVGVAVGEDVGEDVGVGVGPGVPTIRYSTLWSPLYSTT